MCFPAIDDQKWLSNLEASQWLDHGKQILSGAVKIVEKVKNIFLQIETCIMRYQEIMFSLDLLKDPQ